METIKMSMAEIAEYLKTNSTIIIPIGAVEEHSKALPLHLSILCMQQRAAAYCHSHPENPDPGPPL